MIPVLPVGAELIAKVSGSVDCNGLPNNLFGEDLSGFSAAAFSRFPAGVAEEIDEGAICPSNRPGIPAASNRIKPIIFFIGLFSLPDASGQ